MDHCVQYLEVISNVCFTHQSLSSEHCHFNKLLEGLALQLAKALESDCRASLTGICLQISSSKDAETRNDQ